MDNSAGQKITIPSEGDSIPEYLASRADGAIPTKTDLVDVGIRNGDDTGKGKGKEEEKLVESKSMKEGSGGMSGAGDLKLESLATGSEFVSGTAMDLEDIGIGYETGRGKGKGKEKEKLVDTVSMEGGGAGMSSGGFDIGFGLGLDVDSPRDGRFETSTGESARPVGSHFPTFPQATSPQTNIHPLNRPNVPRSASTAPTALEIGEYKDALNKWTTAESFRRKGRRDAWRACSSCVSESRKTGSLKRRRSDAIGEIVLEQDMDRLAKRRQQIGSGEAEAAVTGEKESNVEDYGDDPFTMTPGETDGGCEASSDPQSPSTSSSSTSSPSAVSVLLNSPTKSSKPQSDPSLHPSSPCSHGSARYAESANVLLRDMSEVVGTGKSVELVEEQEQVEEHMLRLIHSIRYHQAGIVRQTRENELRPIKRLQKTSQPASAQSSFTSAPSSSAPSKAMGGSSSSSKATSHAITSDKQSLPVTLESFWKLSIPDRESLHLPAGFPNEMEYSTYGHLVRMIGKTKAKAAIRDWYSSRARGVKRERDGRDNEIGEGGSAKAQKANDGFRRPKKDRSSTAAVAEITSGVSTMDQAQSPASTSKSQKKTYDPAFRFDAASWDVSAPPEGDALLSLQRLQRLLHVIHKCRADALTKTDSGIQASDPTEEWRISAEAGSMWEANYLKLGTPAIMKEPLLAKPDRDFPRYRLSISTSVDSREYFIFVSGKLDANILEQEWVVSLKQDQDCRMSVFEAGQEHLTGNQIQRLLKQFNSFPGCGTDSADLTAPIAVAVADKNGGFGDDDVSTLVRCFGFLEGLAATAEFLEERLEEGLPLDFTLAKVWIASTDKKDCNLRGLLEHMFDGIIGWYHAAAVLLYIWIHRHLLQAEGSSLAEVYTGVAKGLESNLVLRRLMTASGWTKACRVGTEGICPLPSWISAVQRLPPHGDKDATKHLSDKGEAGLGCTIMAGNKAHLPALLQWSMEDVDRYERLLGSGLYLPAKWEIDAKELELSDETEAEREALLVVKSMIGRSLEGKDRLLMRAALQGPRESLCTPATELFAAGFTLTGQHVLKSITKEDITLKGISTSPTFNSCDAHWQHHRLNVQQRLRRWAEKSNYNETLFNATVKSSDLTSRMQMIVGALGIIFCEEPSALLPILDAINSAN